MNDHEILRLIQTGWLVVCIHTLEVWHYNQHRKKMCLRKPQAHEKSGRVRYCFGKKRRTVYRNKLVWMQTYQRVVPEGYYIDHVDEDCLNDAPKNLQLMAYKESHQQGDRIRLNTAYDEVMLFFADKIPF